MTGQKCAVDSCVTDYNVLKQFGVTLRFFSFPRDELVRNEWLYRCSRGSNDFSHRDTICSRHFTFSDYDDSVVSKIANSKPKRLNPNAVPSLFMEKRPRKVLKRDIIEYHKILADEILKEERKEAEGSSEPPIYLEFSQNDPLVLVGEQDPLSSVTNESQSSSQIDYLSEVDPPVKTEDYCSMDLEEELKPFDTYHENMAESIKRSFKRKISVKEFIGHCYICDKTIGESDLGKVSKADFTRVVQKVLEGIGTGLVVVMKEDDGLCGMCRSLVDRILKLEAELRTTSLGLRALLRLKYSLPPPSPLTGNNESKVQVSFKETNSVKATNSVGRMNSGILQPISSPTVKRKKNVITQTENSTFNFLYRQRHKLTQTSPMENKNHKKTQTIDPDRPPSKKEEITYVSNVNEVECLELGETLETSSDWISESVPVEGMFEDISDVTELTTLLNDDLLVEEGEVMTETTETTIDSEAVISKPVATSGSATLSILKCARCRYRTKSHKRMKEHMLSFINEERLRCSICDFTFHKLASYNKHVAAHSETSQNKRCIFCDDEIHDRHHMRFHIEAKHKLNSFSHRCPMCPRVFLFAYSMRKHIRTQHKVKNSYKCGKCDKIFTDGIKYNSHVEYRHRDTLNCKFCLKMQSSVERLIAHEVMYHRFDRGPVYKCSYCPKKFVRHELLPRHELRHTGEFPFRCSDCGYGFHEPVSLEKHRRGCIILMRRAAEDDDSEAQSDTKNKGGHNSLVCDVCGKVIKTRSKYKIHRELHDNPPTFQCHMCGKSFRYKMNMNVHIKNYHPDAE